jgi:hypothetical protein
MAYSNFSLKRMWRVCVALAVAVGIAALAGSLIGNGLIPALLQLGVQG